MSFMLLGILNSQVSGGAGVPAYDHIETITATNGTSEVTFSNLNNLTDYKHLQIRITGRQNISYEISRWTELRINNTSSGYYWHWLESNGGVAKQDYALNDDSIWLPRLPASNSGSNYAGSIVVDIYDFLETTENPAVKFFGGSFSSSSERSIISGSGRLDSNTAVSELSFKHYSTVSSWGANSAFSLYGVKG